MSAHVETKIEVSRASLWFGLLGGAIAWSVHFISAYVVAEFGCVGGLGERSYWNISYVAWLELGLTVFAFLMAAFSTMVAYRSQRGLASGTACPCSEQCAVRSTARAGMLSSGLFTFVILFESIPIFFYLHRC